MFVQRLLMEFLNVFIQTSEAPKNSKNIIQNYLIIYIKYHKRLNMKLKSVE